MLQLMGAEIEGIGSNVLRVFGVPTLTGTDVTIGPNHIEAASIAGMAAITGGRVQIDGIRRADLRMIAKIYQRLGEDDPYFVRFRERRDLTFRRGADDGESGIRCSELPCVGMRHAETQHGQNQSKGDAFHVWRSRSGEAWRAFVALGS